MNADVEGLRDVLDHARTEISKVIIGQDDVINASLIAIFTGQHALVEGVPGVGKTLLVRTLAKVLGCDFSRIQFTPDLMPADITGTNIFDLQQNTFTLVKGPVFTSFLLGDEINRAPAKTQSALLQAMQERRVTIDTKTHELSPNFTVFATQNPIEYEGTYPLPEAQKDRFMLKISMSAPSESDELRLAGLLLGEETPERVLDSGTVQPVVSDGDLSGVRKGLQGIALREEITAYIVALVRKTRVHDSVLVGAGPRGTQALLLASRAYAAINGQDYVTPDDVKAMALPTLGHRMVLRPEYEIEGVTIAEVVERLLQDVAVPR